MTKNDLSQILYALEVIFGKEKGKELFEKLIKFINS